MLVDFGTHRIYVQIQHGKREVLYKGSLETQRYTSAKIWKDDQISTVTDQKGKVSIRVPEEPFVEAISSVHSTDSFNKHKGLVIALTRAIHEYNETIIKKMETSFFLKKFNRKKIWEQMFHGKYNTISIKKRN